VHLLKNQGKEVKCNSFITEDRGEKKKSQNTFPLDTDRSWLGGRGKSGGQKTMFGIIVQITGEREKIGKTQLPHHKTIRLKRETSCGKLKEKLLGCVRTKNWGAIKQNSLRGSGP